MAASNYRPDIDGLRSIAVLSVLFYHVGFLAFSGGFVGVDIFFVISGFLITRLIRDEVDAGTFSFATFYMRRVRRLVPTMLVTLALTFVFSYMVLSPADMELFAGSMVAAILSVSNIFFWWTTDYFGADAIVQPLLHTWSLGVEEQFYFVWPALLFLFLTRFPRWAVFGFLALAGVASVIAAEMWIDADPAAAFFLLPFRVVEFAVGAAMVWIVRFQPRNPVILEPIFVGGMAAIAVAIFTFTEATPFPGINALLPCLGTALLLYAGQATHLGHLLRNRVAVGIGLISYTLYLVHWPVTVLYSYYNFHELTLSDRLLIIAISFGLSFLIYRYIENPLRRGQIGSRRIPNPVFATVATATAIAVAIPGAAAYQGKGWEWRVPDEAREWLAQSEMLSDPKPMKKPKDARFRVLLLGDSHSRAYSTMLKEYFGERRIHLIHDRTQCVPIPNVMRFVDGKFVRRCDRYARTLIRKIQKGNYDGVILAARWSSTTNGAVDARESGAEFRTFAFGDKESVARKDFSPENSKRIFTEKLNDFAKSLTEIEMPTMIMGQVPPLGVNLRPCLAVRGKDCRPHYTKRQAQERIQFNNETFAQLEADYPVIQFVDAFDRICGSATDYCPIFEDNTFLYRDGNHINPLGSLAMLDRFTEDFDRFVDRMEQRTPDTALAPTRPRG